MGIREFVGTGYCVDHVQTTQMIMSHGSRTSQLHKSIAQMNRTNKMTSRPGKEMTNDAFGCSRATQVCMEDLRLVNLTEICPSQRGGCFKAPS